MFSQRRDGLKSMVMISETRCTTELKVGIFLLCQSSSCPYGCIIKAAWFQAAYKSCCAGVIYTIFTFFFNKRQYLSATPSRCHAGKKAGFVASP